MPPEIDLWKQIAAAGLPALLMAIALRYLVNSNTTLITQLNGERSERLDSMEKHMSECDADRKELRVELLRLARIAGPGDEYPHDPATHHSYSLQGEEPQKKKTRSL